MLLGRWGGAALFFLERVAMIPDAATLPQPRWLDRETYGHGLASTCTRGRGSPVGDAAPSAPPL